MTITREKHLQYMVDLAPFLIIAIVVQSYLYHRFFPGHLAMDITVFLSVGVALILGGFYAYDHFHRVQLKENYLEISIRPLKYQEEILYRNIVAYEVLPTRHGFANVKLHLKDGHAIKILYVDDANRFVQLIEKKQGRK